MKKSSKSLAGKRLVDLIVMSVQEKRGEKIAVIDHRKSVAFATADYFIICESETSVQNRAIADAIIDSCAEKETRPWHQEGIDEGRWILLDFSDVVVHIMLSELRSYYNLEGLWETGIRTDVPDVKDEFDKS
jgi:ribosome-associated protein